jgi:hypothetical protein
MNQRKFIIRGAAIRQRSQFARQSRRFQPVHYGEESRRLFRMARTYIMPDYIGICRKASYGHKPPATSGQL